MMTNVRLSWFTALLLAAATLLVAAARATAAEQVPWVADFQAACGMAAEQHRLVLLHFYNDNCGPCVRLDQNVFSKAEVAEAVSQNYLAVKVHAGKNPQLASRYRVQQWPTDVIVTPSGLEVFRTISPQKPEDYMAMLHQVALQTGVGLARQWKSQMGQTLAAAASSTQTATNSAQTAAKTAVDGAQQQAEQGLQQATAMAQQSTTAASRWSQQASEAVQQYEKQAGDSYRQFRQQTGEVAHQVQQQTETTRSQWQATAQKASEEVGQAAHGLKDQMHQVGQNLLDRRSSFIPPDPSPATQPAAAAAATNPAANHTTSTPAAAQTSTATAKPQPADKPAPSLTTNPWVAGNQPAATSPSASKPATTPQPAFVPAQPQPTGPPQEATVANRQMIPVSQAPPIALDGFCPVTLQEVINHNPADRGAWKKGDRRFGAIHDGRTYLFASAEQQQKFLANPDAYAPVLAGCDPVLFAERGQMIDGKRAYGLITADHQVYLFADEATLNRFKQSPGNYAGAIQQAKARADGGNLYR